MIAADRCHTMDGVAPFEQQQRARMHRYAHHAFAGTLEQTLNARIVFIRRAANQRHVFEIAAGCRRSKRYRRDEVGLVEMPVQAFAFSHHGEIERAHRIGVAIEAVFFQRRRDEFHQRIPFEQPPQRGLGRKLIVSDNTYRGRFEKLARMILRQRSIGSCQIGRAGHDAVIRERRERIALSHQHRDRLGLEKSGQFAGAGAVELIAAMTGQFARGIAAQFEDRIAFEIDQVRRRGFVDGLRLHAH